MCSTYIFYERHSKKTNFSESSVRERSSWGLQSDRKIKNADIKHLMPSLKNPNDGIEDGSKILSSQID